MANDKSMSPMAFQSKLKEFYESKGEVDVENRIETLTSAIIKQRDSVDKDNIIPFIDFLKVIKNEDIKLDELVGSNGTVRVDKIGVIIEKVKSISYQQKFQQNENKAQNSATEPTISNIENIEKLKNIDYTGTISSEDLKAISDNWDDWWKIATTEQKTILQEQVFEGQTSEKSQFFNKLYALYNKGDIIDGEPITDEGKKFFIEYENFIKENGLSEEQGVLKKDVFSNAMKTYTDIYSKVSGALKKSNSNASLEEVKSRLEIDPDLLVKAEEFGFNIEECIVATKKRINPEKVSTQHEQTEKVEQEEITNFDEFSSEQLENYFDLEFAQIEDPAEQLGVEQTADTQPTMLETPEDIKSTEEEQYEVPVFETQEKKGLTKFFSNIMKRFQNRNAKRLDAPQEQRKPEGVSTSKLDPVIPEENPVKRTTNRFVEGFLGLFRKDNKDDKPAQAMEPVNPNNSWEVSDDIKASVVSVGQAAGEKETDKIIPKEIKGKTSDAPSFDDNL